MNTTKSEDKKNALKKRNKRMKKFAKYIILPEYRLIINWYKGGVSADEAVTMKKEQLSDKLYDSNYNIIVDLRELSFALNSRNICSISKYIDILKDMLLKNKVALLTNTPNQVVLGQMIKQLCSELFLSKYEIFSTLDSALNYVDCPSEDFDIISNKINTLKITTSL